MLWFEVGVRQKSILSMCAPVNIQCFTQYQHSLNSDALTGHKHLLFLAISAEQLQATQKEFQ